MKQYGVSRHGTWRFLLWWVKRLAGCRRVVRFVERTVWSCMIGSIAISACLIFEQWFLGAGEGLRGVF